MKASDFDVFIVKRRNEYLVALPYSDTLFLRWSTSPYDSCPIHRKRIAERVADRVGGEVVQFNPLLGVVW